MSLDICARVRANHLRARATAPALSFTVTATALRLCKQKLCVIEARVRMASICLSTSGGVPLPKQTVVFTSQLYPVWSDSDLASMPIALNRGWLLPVTSEEVQSQSVFVTAATITQWGQITYTHPFEDAVQTGSIYLPSATITQWYQSSYAHPDPENIQAASVYLTAGTITQWGQVTYTHPDPENIQTAPVYITQGTLT